MTFDLYVNEHIAAAKVLFQHIGLSNCGRFTAVYNRFLVKFLTF